MDDKPFWEKFFSKLRNYWYGTVLVLIVFFGIIYGTLQKVFDSIKLDDPVKINQVSPIFLKPLFLQIFLSFFFALVCTLIIDLLFKKINKKEIEKKELEKEQKRNEEIAKLTAEKQLAEQLLAEKLKVREDFLATLENIGINEAAAHLRHSVYEPSHCMQQARRRLLFLGISGAKWVSQPGNAFENFVRKIHGANGKVKFLLIDPSCEAFKEFKTLRGNDVEGHHTILTRLHQLSQKYPCLQVKVYQRAPSFRLISIDEKEIIISPYKLDQAGYLASDKGWSNPHVPFHADAPWSFYNLFDNYYYFLWGESKDLATYISDKKNGSKRSPRN